MSVTLPDYTKTPAFDVGTPCTVDALNTGQGAAVALTIGTKSFEKFVRYVKPSTVTGTQNDYDIDALAVSPATGIALLNWAGASDVTFTGFTGGLDGRTLLISNTTSAKVLRIVTQSGSSVAANRCINVSSVAQNIGPGGSAYLWYDGTASRWRVELLSPGAPITPTFAAGDFTASGSQTWTVAAGDVVSFNYVQIGKLLFVNFNISATTVGGTPSTELRIALPGSFVAASSVEGLIRAIDNGSKAVGSLYVAAASSYIACYRSVAGTDNWSAATDASYVLGQVIIPIT